MISNDEEKKSSSLPMKKRRLTYDPDPQAEGGVVKTEDLCVQLQGEVPPTHHPPSLSAVDDEAADEVKKGQAEKKRKRKRSIEEPLVHPLIEKQRGGGNVLPASSSLQGKEISDDTPENEEGEKEEVCGDISGRVYFMWSPVLLDPWMIVGGIFESSTNFFTISHDYNSSLYPLISLPPPSGTTGI